MDDRRRNEGRTDQSGPCSVSGQEHEWVVFSTALREGWLMLQCVGCGATGTVDDPTEEEWSEAYYAPARPYVWTEDKRITLRRFAAPHVIRAIDGRRCECPSQRSLPPSRGYERIPGGISEHREILTDEEKEQLDQLAEFVSQSDLCSRLLPVFIRSCEQETGCRHNDATHAILRRIERWDEIGLHCSPPVVAKILRDYAAWSRPKTWQRYKGEGLCTHCGRAWRGKTLKCDLCREIESTGRRLASLRRRRKGRNLSIPAHTIR